MNPYQNAWTADEDTLLAKLWIQGDSTSMIATKLSHAFHRDVTKNAVVGRRRRIPGLVDRGNPIKAIIPREVKEQVSALYQSGSSTGPISKKTGLSKGAVRRLREESAPVFVLPALTSPSPTPKPVFERPAPRPAAVIPFQPSTKCLSPDGCGEKVAPHTPYSYCARHRREYYSYDPMTDRRRAADAKVNTPWTGVGFRGPGGQIEPVEELEKVE